jgi:hypothetical protein
LRAAFLYFPNGVVPEFWWPEGDGTDFRLSRSLQPLEAWRDQLQILAGLDDKSAVSVHEGGGDHARAAGTFLTGVRIRKSATDIRAGVSIDQLIARRISHLTRFPSLELTCDSSRLSGACNAGYSCVYVYNVSWSSPTTPASPEPNPRQAFERLFGAGPPGEREANLCRRRQEQRSILDCVMEDARQMNRRLNAGDRDKLDQYLSGVRNLESRLLAAERLGDPRDLLAPAPGAVPADYAEHIDLMLGIIALAFQSDSTRVASLVFAHDGSDRPFPEIGISESHHELSHHFGDLKKMRKVADIDRWYVQRLAQFLQKLEDIKDADGQSVLRNSMIVYGSGNEDGNRHNHANLPVILAGGGGGALRPGRYVNHKSAPIANLFLGLADRLGLDDLGQFGDATGRLQNI